LRPDRLALKWILDELGPADILQLDGQTRDLFSRAVTAIKSGRNGADVHALEVRRFLSAKGPKAALTSGQTLSVFFSCVLSKKYAHPSSDVISILAGIDAIDPALIDFIATADGIIRSGQTCR